MKTILIITANDPGDRLQLLAREGKDIQHVLNGAVRKNYEVVLLPETTTEDIVKELNVANQEVVLLHYAGHANSTILRLTDVDASAKALAEKLRSLTSLKVVFINGCASQGQVEYFHKAGIPFVVATVRSVQDDKAAWVAHQFYQYLSKGRSVRTAFAEVVKDADLQHKSIHFAGERGIGRIGDKPQQAQSFDWGLYIQDGADNQDFTLPFGKKDNRFKWLLILLIPILSISLGYYFYKSQMLKQPQNLTVVLDNKTPNPNLPPEKATLTLTYGDKTENQTTEKEAVFKGIPSNFKDEPMRLQVEANGFKALDTTFSFTENALTVPISRNNSLGTIYGSVKDEKGYPVAGVQISVQDLAVVTDATGQFSLPIPFGKQLLKQRLRATKQGFKVWDYETPVMDTEIPIILKR